MKNHFNLDEDQVFILQVAGIFFVSFVLVFTGAVIFNLIPHEFEVADDYQPGAATTADTDVEYTRQRIVRQEDGAAYSQPIDDGFTPEDVRIAVGTSPDSVRIPSIDLNWDIEKPSSPHIDTLNAALDVGPVYYPGSGFVEDGNIFLFGHSSYLPVVYNKAYKAFNGLQKLTAGDEIYLEADGQTYVYAVENVERVNADAALIDLSEPGRRLTLSTCDVFGQKSDRWVVDAVFVRAV